MLLFFASCNNKSNNSLPVLSTESDQYVAEYYDNYDEGRVIGGFDGNDGIPSQFLDYETMESTVLCSKPNCTHNNNECVAKNIGTCPIITQDGIYFFKSNYGVKEEKNGKKSSI